MFPPRYNPPYKRRKQPFPPAQQSLTRRSGISPARIGPTPDHPVGKRDLLSSFRTADGKFDYKKISSTAMQIKGVYNQISPMLMRFLGR